MFMYGLDSFMITYVCDCDIGEVCLSQEHTDYQWIDPVAYRNQFFSDENVAMYTKINPNYETIAKSIQSEIDIYINYCTSKQC